MSSLIAFNSCMTLSFLVCLVIPHYLRGFRLCLVWFSVVNLLNHTREVQSTFPFVTVGARSCVLKHLASLCKNPQVFRLREDLGCISADIISLWISKRKESQGTKLSSYFNFYSLYNTWKERSLTNGFLDPKRFSELSALLPVPLQRSLSTIKDTRTKH